MDCSSYVCVLPETENAGPHELSTLVSSSPNVGTTVVMDFGKEQ